jgi:hypothetical protein
MQRVLGWDSPNLYQRLAVLFIGVHRWQIFLFVIPLYHRSSLSITG